MNKDLPPELDRERLNQWTKEELVEMIIGQAIAINQLQATIEELKQEIEKLRVSRDIDSKTSSKPPSSDLLKKSEHKKTENQTPTDVSKRKPGGQLGFHKSYSNLPSLIQIYSLIALILACRQWQQTLDESIYNDWANKFKQRVQLTLKQWMGKAGGTAGKLLRSLRDKAEQWWYFLEHPEIPPDNNLAERSLRLAVTKRKVSGGDRSMERFQDTAYLLTVVQTCRRQERSVIDFFEQALKAQLHASQTPPSLIPQS